MKLTIFFLACLTVGLTSSYAMVLKGQTSTTQEPKDEEVLHGLYWVATGELPSGQTIRNKRYSFNTGEQSRTETVEQYADPRVNHLLNRISGTVTYLTPDGKTTSYSYVGDGSGYHVYNNP